MKNRRAGKLIIFCLIIFTVVGFSPVTSGNLKDSAKSPAADTHTMKSAVVNAGAEIQQEIKERDPLQTNRSPSRKIRKKKPYLLTRKKRYRRSGDPRQTNWMRPPV